MKVNLFAYEIIKLIAEACFYTTQKLKSTPNKNTHNNLPGIEPLVCVLHLPGEPLMYFRMYEYIHVTCEEVVQWQKKLIHNINCMGDNLSTG